jgi:carbonic anhydrase
MPQAATSTAVLTCMDARLDARSFLDAYDRPSYVLRNAGARASEDAVRSLIVACAKGVRRVIVLHHTDCAMATLSQEALRSSVAGDVANEIDFLTIADPDSTLRSDVDLLKEHPGLPADLEVAGYSFNMDTAESRLVHHRPAHS